MNKKLAVVGVGGCAFLGGCGRGPRCFRATNSIAAQGPPLPPVPAAFAARPRSRPRTRSRTASRPSSSRSARRSSRSTR